MHCPECNNEMNYYGYVGGCKFLHICNKCGYRIETKGNELPKTITGRWSSKTPIFQIVEKGE